MQYKYQLKLISISSVLLITSLSISSVVASELDATKCDQFAAHPDDPRKVAAVPDRFGRLE